MLDWRTGATLQMTGTAEIIWEASGPGSQCAVELTIQRVVQLAGVSPLSWGAAELSPANPV